MSVDLSGWQLAFSALLVVALAFLFRAYRLGVSQSLLVASARLVAQLFAIGYALKFLFEQGRFGYVALLAAIMVLVAAREIVVRQKRRLKGFAAYRLAGATVFVASFAVALYGLLIVVQPEPWYSPRYAIPLLGMVMSNTMSGISLSLDRLTSAMHDNRGVIEQKLALGMTRAEATRPYVKDCIRSGMMPVINAMATAGIVSLPGMMTGQILGGASPLLAVEYQIMIWFLIAAGSGFGMTVALRVMEGKLFDDRQRLRLERLASPK